ncbi:MAG: hypothetical protein HOO67_05855 [Candidatus Peribacteraceae bacterium]|nr:hypothetical protein [Candidatus Peribacteraceae bacterium]
MLSLSSILPQIVLGDPILQYGLQHRLFNLSQLARHIQPHVEVRAKKEVSVSAILMALSRYQKQLKKIAPKAEQFKISKLTVHTGLGVFSFEKSKHVLETANALHKSILDKGGYLTISESISEVTVIVDRAFEPTIRKHLGRRIKYENMKISALAIHFSPAYLPVPGLLCLILQQIMLQGINLEEVASTYTEFVLYIGEADTQLAFDTLYRLFDVEG